MLSDPGKLIVKRVLMELDVEGARRGKRKVHDIHKTPKKRSDFFMPGLYTETRKVLSRYGVRLQREPRPELPH